MRTERVAAGSRRPAAIGATLVLGLMLFAVLKPWSAGVPAYVPATARASSPAASPAASPGIGALPTRAPAPTIDPLVMRKQCQNPDLWRLVTVEQSGPLEGRSLLPVTLVAASGPTDPRIVPQILHTGALLALGYCLPTAFHADVVAAEGGVSIWQSIGGGTPRPLSGARVADPGLASVGEVYLEPSIGGPVGENASVDPDWPQGRYVFETPSNLPGGAPGWFAFTFASTALAVAGRQP